MKVRQLLSPLLFLALVSCIKDPDAGQFGAPSILGVSAEPDGTAVVLSCEVSRSDNILGCGFLFGLNTSEMGIYEAELCQAGKFSCQMPGLTFGVKYYYRSYIDGGGDSLQSELSTFEIDQQLPDIGPLTLSVKDGSTVSCEYSVTEQFSGTMYVCGVCWGTESGPGIDGAGKTVDSSEYGTHKVDITGLTTGETYYFRPYAINGKGTVYGEERSLRLPVVLKDAALQAYLVSAWDSDSDGMLSVEEAAAVTGIDICSDDVASLDGLSQFANLTTLRCVGTSSSGRGGSGSLSSADLSGNPKLASFDLSCNKLTSIVFGSSLEELNISSNPVQSLSLPEETALRSLDLSNTAIASLDYEGLGSLEEIRIGGSALSIDNTVNKLRSIKRLYVGGKLRDATKVYLLSKLEVLDCEGSAVTALDLRYNPALTSLNADGCQLVSLDLNLNPAVKSLHCMCSTLKTLYLLEGQEIDGINKGQRLYIPANVEIVYTPKISDAVFERYLVDKFDTDYDSFVSLAEAAVVNEINIDKASYSGIASLHGIHMFSALETLQLPGQVLTSLDLRGNPALKMLCCDSNPLASLDLRGNPALTMLYCQSCAQLVSLDLSGNQLLEAAYLSRCALKTLDVSRCTALKTLDCSNNPSLTAITVSRSQSISITKDGSTEIIYCD